MLRLIILYGSRGWQKDIVQGVASIFIVNAAFAVLQLRAATMPACVPDRQRSRLNFRFGQQRGGRVSVC